MTKDEQRVASTNTLANMVALVCGVAVKIGGETMTEAGQVTDELQELVGAKLQQKLAPLGE